MAPHESVAYAYISSIKGEGEDGEVGWGGDGVFVREEGGGGLLSEAHNLIIQSIEQHIHFIVLQISSKLAGLIGSPSERNRAALCRKEGAADEISRLISQERRYCLFFFLLLLLLMLFILEYDDMISSLTTAFVISDSEWREDDTNMRERCRAEMFLERR